MVVAVRTAETPWAALSLRSTISLDFPMVRKVRSERKGVVRHTRLLLPCSMAYLEACSLDLPTPSAAELGWCPQRTWNDVASKPALALRSTLSSSLCHGPTDRGLALRHQRRHCFHHRGCPCCQHICEPESKASSIVADFLSTLVAVDPCCFRARSGARLARSGDYQRGIQIHTMPARVNPMSCCCCFG